MAATYAPNCEENEARRRMLSAAINHIRDLRSRDNPADEEALGDLLHHYQQRLEEAESTSTATTSDAANYEQYRVLSSQLRGVERSAILRLRDQNTISDEVLRTLERDLDMMDARFLSSRP
jgi:CPA1 family monovalent cation:H+ antiporter